MIYYAIRHKATGELMPQMKRGRGYSHWNPSTKKEDIQVFSALDTPRLFSTLRKANKCATLWAVQPNLEMKLRYDSFGGDNYSLDTKEDGRSRADIEVVQVDLEVSELK